MIMGVKRWVVITIMQGLKRVRGDRDQSSRGGMGWDRLTKIPLQKLDNAPGIGPAQAGVRTSVVGVTVQRFAPGHSQSSNAFSFAFSVGAIGGVGLGAVVSRRRLAGLIGPEHRLALG